MEEDSSILMMKPLKMSASLVPSCNNKLLYIEIVYKETIIDQNVNGFDCMGILSFEMRFMRCLLSLMNNLYAKSSYLKMDY